LVGRADLLSTVESQLAAGGSVVLTGSSGIGKTAVMDALGSTAAARGEWVLRVAGTETERWISNAGLADLFSQVPLNYLAELPEPQRAAVNAVLQRGSAGGAASQARLARRLAWQALLERCALAGGVLILIDDAQWLDAASADVIAYAARRVNGCEVRAVVAERWPEPAAVAMPAPIPEREGHDQQAGEDLDDGDEDGGVLTTGSIRLPVRAASLAPGPVLEIAVPPLDAADLAELLDLYALPARAVGKLHADSGGNPYLALALGGAFADRASVSWRPVPLPQRLHALLRDRIGMLPAEIRETLLIAALATRPTVELLLRAGRSEAERDIRLTVDAGLLVTDGSLIRFTPPAVATVVAELETAARRSTVHTALSTVVTDAVERARHRALASADPDAEVARSIVTAAEDARRRGARALAAELYLLAADRTPPELDAERLDWLVSAAEVGAAALRPEIVTRAAEAVITADSSPAHRVRVRIALIDLSGQALAEMDETFAAAVADADDDPALMAPLRLRLAWQAMVDGQPLRGEAEAEAAISLAHAVDDTTTEAMALAVKAQVARVLGRRDYRSTLDQALGLPQPALDGLLHLTPRYLAARFAVFDDRLEDAREDLFKMLALVERGGGEELIGVLCGLAEVSAHAGRCRDALDFAGRAIRVTQEAGLSPGPAWRIGAIAELAGGTLARAAAYAERGLSASEQERDSIFLGRNLHALGQAKLRTGDARGGVDTLRRIRVLEQAQGVAEPSVLRWHSDLASGLVAIGELDEAEETIRLARAAIVNQTHNAGVTSRLDRAEALVRAERGDVDLAVNLLGAAVRRFQLLGQPIEQGHTLLVLGQVERRRRRHAGARTAVGDAIALFTRIGAKPWVDQATRTLARLAGITIDPRKRPDVVAVLATLTATEAGIATMVREGASNREIAARMFLSVKTVEAALTRVYRKLGVRSRTQLSSRLGSSDLPGGNRGAN
jgi:DNA-binding CsgD family transcriptional regulator/tetratricopeptide (TPR) repeat protein